MRKEIFLKTVDDSVITMFGVKEILKDLTFSEIKEKILKYVIKVPEIEIIMKLNKYKWNGIQDPICFKIELEN